MASPATRLIVRVMRPYSRRAAVPDSRNERPPYQPKLQNQVTSTVGMTVPGPASGGMNVPNTLEK